MSNSLENSWKCSNKMVVWALSSASLIRIYAKELKLKKSNWFLGEEGSIQLQSTKLIS